MRDSLITLAGAVLSLILIIGLFNSEQGKQVPISRPTTEDTGQYGLKALLLWLQENGVVTNSLRKPYSKLNENLNSPGGNLMVMSLPHNRETLETEWQALSQWVHHGNSVLVLSALYHRPPWSYGGHVAPLIEKLTGQEFKLYAPDNDNGDDKSDQLSENNSNFSLDDLQKTIRSFNTQQLHLHPAFEHPLFEGVDTLVSKYMPALTGEINNVDQTDNAYWSVHSPSSRLGLKIVRAKDESQVAMWLLPVGEGWVYLSAFPDLISNGMLDKSDNAKWFSNLVNISLTSQGQVVFDDYHFGLSDLYDPEAFFSDKRFHNTLLFIGALWLVYAIGMGTRLAPVREKVKFPQIMDFIDAMAGFFVQRINRKILGNELAGHFIGSIMKKRNLNNDEVWVWLKDRSGVEESDVTNLQRAVGLVRGKIKLESLTQSINRINKALI